MRSIWAYRLMRLRCSRIVLSNWIAVIMGEVVERWVRDDSDMSQSVWHMVSASEKGGSRPVL